jgi:hypothetical protein
MEMVEDVINDELPTQEHDMQWAWHCGALVCIDCGYHDGLARCFCGWAEDGGDGYQQLRDMGEPVDEDY